MCVEHGNLTVQCLVVKVIVSREPKLQSIVEIFPFLSQLNNNVNTRRAWVLLEHRVIGSGR